MVNLILLGGLLFIFYIFFKKQRNKLEVMKKDEDWENNIGYYKNHKSSEKIEKERLRKEMDRLLAKISKTGMSSLSEKERVQLEAISNELG